MPTLTSKLIVQLVDGVSGPARGAARALGRLNAAAVSGGRGGGLVAMQDRMRRATERNNHAIGVLQGRMFGAAAGAYGLHRALSPTVGAAVKFETIMEDLGQKADVSGERLKGVGKQIRQIAKDTKQGVAATASGVDFLVGMGLGGKDDAENLEAALKMAEPIGKTARAFRADVTELAKSAHAVFFNLKTPADQMQHAFDAMAQAGQQGGFELKDMAKEFAGITASAQFLGMRGVPAVADLAAALQVARTGAQDGAAAANNMMNFFQKITLRETVQKFKKFGVDVYKELAFARKKNISPIEHFMNVLMRVTKGNQDKVSQIFGDKQVLEFIRPMWAQMERYKQIRAEALKATGYTEEMFARRAQTAQTRFESLARAIGNLRVVVGDALLPGLGGTSERLERLVDQIAEFVERFPRLTAGLLAVSTGLVGLKIAGIAAALAGRYAYGGLLMLGRGAALLATPFAFVGGALGRRVVGFFQTLALRARLAGNPGVFARIADGFTVMARGMLRLLNPMNVIRGLGALLGSLGPLGWAAAAAIAVVAYGVAVVAKNWEKMKAFGSGLWQGFMEGLAPVGESLRPVADAMSSLLSSVSGLIPELSGSNAEWAEWGKTIGGTVAQGVNAVVSAIEKVIGFLSTAITKAVEFGSAIKSWWSGGSAAPSGGGAPAPKPAPARAGGGRVSRGRAYLVGERRPELFVPGASGRIEPRVPDGRASSPVVNQTLHIAISGAGDPEAVANRAAAIISRKTTEGLRSIFGDTGPGFAY